MDKLFKKPDQKEGKDTYSELTGAIWDGAGENVDHAVRVAKDLKKVYYFSEWSETYQFKPYAIGMGMAPNLEKVDDFMEPINDEKVDAIFFFDIGAGQLCDFLRKTLDIPVYGAGRSEELEKYRDRARHLQHKIGLPTQETHFVKGLEKLQDFAQKEKGKWFCKHNIFRKVIESFPMDSFLKAKNHFNKLAFELGPFAEDQLFIVEENIKGKTELGIDAFFNGKEFLRPIMWGREKGKPYCGRWSETLPPFMEKFIEKITPELKKRDHRGAISVEFQVMNKDLAFPIDFTCRFPSPCGLIFTEAIENYTNVLMACAEGESIKIKPSSRYVMGAQVDCDYSESNWLSLDIKEEDRNRVKLYGCCYADGHYQIIPGMAGKIWLMSLGSNLNTMIKEIEALAKRVDGFEIDDSHIRDLYGIVDEVRKYPAMGIEF